MKRIEEYELIERYLTQKLSRVELDEFNQRLKNDIEWAQLVENHRQMKNLLVDSALLDIKTKLRNIHNQKLIIKRKKQNIIKSVGFSIGVGLIISFILFLNLRKEQINSNDLSIPFDNIVADSIPNNTLSYCPSEKSKILEKSKLTKQTDTIHKKNIPIEFIPIVETPALIDTNLKQNIQIQVVDSQKVNSDNVIKDVIEQAKMEKKKICKLKSEVIVSASCSNENTGSIEFIKSTIKYGTPPFLFSIDSTHFKTSAIFDKLAGGTYYPVIKDAAGCVTAIGAKYIAIKNCNLEFVFAPSKGELWKIPMPYNKSGSIKIYSRSGKLVFNNKVPYEENNYWDGKSNSNTELPMGAYYFTIECTDGEIVKGLITIVR